MKGYVVSYGYMGYMPSTKNYQLFSSDTEYEECYNATETN